jgi:hypothetical protein
MGAANHELHGHYGYGYDGNYHWYEHHDRYNNGNDGYHHRYDNDNHWPELSREPDRERLR